MHPQLVHPMTLTLCDIASWSLGNTISQPIYIASVTTSATTINKMNPNKEAGFNCVSSKQFKVVILRASALWNIHEFTRRLGVSQSLAESRRVSRSAGNSERKWRHSLAGSRAYRR